MDFVSSLESPLLKPLCLLCRCSHHQQPHLLQSWAAFGTIQLSRLLPSWQETSVRSCKATEFHFKLLPNLAFGRDGSKSKPCSTHVCNNTRISGTGVPSSSLSTNGPQPPPLTLQPLTFGTRMMLLAATPCSCPRPQNYVKANNFSL